MSHQFDTKRHGERVETTRFDTGSGVDLIKRIGVIDHHDSDPIALEEQPPVIRTHQGRAKPVPNFYSTRQVVLTQDRVVGRGNPRQRSVELVDCTRVRFAIDLLAGKANDQVENVVSVQVQGAQEMRLVL